MLRHGPLFLSFQRDTGLVNITRISGSVILAKTRNPLRRNGFVAASFLATMDKSDTAVDTIVSTAVSLFYRRKHCDCKVLSAIALHFVMSKHSIV